MIYLIIILAIIGVIALIWLIRNTAKLYLLVNTTLKEIEITPLAFDDKPIASYSELYRSLHHLQKHRSYKDKFLGVTYPIALIMRSSKQKGVTIAVRVPAHQTQAAESIIKANLPHCKIKVSDYTPKEINYFSEIVRFKQSGHYAFPLKYHDRLDGHDPIIYLINALSDTKPDEELEYKLVIKPACSKDASLLKNKILKNESLIAEMRGKSKFSLNIFEPVNKLLFSAADLVQESVYTDIKPVRSTSVELQRKTEVAKNTRPARTLSYFEYEMVEAVNNKLEQPLFKTNVAVRISAKDKSAVKTRKAMVVSAMQAYNQENYQKLAPKRKSRLIGKWLADYKYRFNLIGGKDYYSLEEISSLFHLPHSTGAKAEEVVKNLSRTLPAPLDIKNRKDADILIGKNIHNGRESDIGLTESERQRHIYIVGGTGNGKTTMLLYSIVQDIKNGKGIAVVDPHGDLAETVLGYIPEERIKDVVYINPDDLAHPVGINLLELRPGLTGDDLLREKDIVTEATISVLRKLFSEDDTGGHRIEYVLRNTIQTALTLDDCNLFTIFRLLNDTKYRKQVVKTLEDEDLKIFWKNELGKAGDFQRVKMAAGITAKIGRFLFSASAKRIMEQSKSTIDFDKLIDEEKIIVCNFSKGNLGEDTSMLFGTTVLAKLQLASLRRAKQQQASRVPFYVYVDEFQNFATVGFIQMLSEARKYKMFLIMAEQSTQQQNDQKFVEVILANVGTVVAFRTGSPADERLLQPLFAPYINKGELLNLPAYNFYIRIAAIKPYEPISGETVVLEELPNKETFQKVLKQSQERNAIKQNTDEVKEQKDKPKVNKVNKKKTKKPENSKLNNKLTGIIK